MSILGLWVGLFREKDFALLTDGFVILPSLVLSIIVATVVLQSRTHAGASTEFLEIQDRMALKGRSKETES